MEKAELESLIINKLKTVYDPEIPINIYDLGLIYEIQINKEFEVVVYMTLTAPNCPEAEELPPSVQKVIEEISEVKSAKVIITFEPAWNKDLMSDEAKFELGFF